MEVNGSAIAPLFLQTLFGLYLLTSHTTLDFSTYDLIRAIGNVERVILMNPAIIGGVGFHAERDELMDVRSQLLDDVFDILADAVASGSEPRGQGLVTRNYDRDRWPCFEPFCRDFSPPSQAAIYPEDQIA